MRINHPTVTRPLIPIVRLAPAKLVMADPGEVLDLVNPCQFDESEWIGKGRTYLASLCTLASAPTVLENGLRISQQDGILFRTLKEGCANVIKAVTLLAGRPKKARPLDEEEEL